MADESVAFQLATLASQYQNVNSAVPVPPNVMTRVATNDPCRLFIRLEIVNIVAGQFAFFSGPPPTSVVSVNVGGGMQESKYNDCPSRTTGEWFCFSTVASTAIISTCRKG